VTLQLSIILLFCSFPAGDSAVYGASSVQVLIHYDILLLLLLLLRGQLPQQQGRGTPQDDNDTGHDVHFDGAEPLDQPLSPTLIDDPGHSIDNTEIIDWSDHPDQGWGRAPQDMGAAARDSGSNSSSAGSSGTIQARAGDIDGQQYAQPATLAATAGGSPHRGGRGELGRNREKPRRLNIVNGRWQPPSKEDAELMMRQNLEMGPDEGV